jgi:hypothetical protein
VVLAKVLAMDALANNAKSKMHFVMADLHVTRA